MSVGGFRSSWARASALAFALCWAGLDAAGVSAQAVQLPPVSATHTPALYRQVEKEVNAALLTSDSQVRDHHLDVAEQLARHLVSEDSMSADAHYWLAVALGIKTEVSGPLQKLTTGREVFFTTGRVLALDSLHAGGHEMMGRLHAAVMRLPWLVRGVALRMGMGQVLGHASWEQAEGHYRRAAALNDQAIAPRLELAKLYVEQDRVAEARPVLQSVGRIAPRTPVDEGMLVEARGILQELEARGSATPP